MSPEPGPSAGLYVHIPFCASKCGYCDFFSRAGVEHLIDPFIDAVIKEADLNADRFGRFDTLYLGGGTPSLLTVDQLDKLLAGLRARFDFAEDAETTLEANPGDLSPDKLGRLPELGFNRLSLGVQSLDRAELTFLGRRHDVARAIESIRAARRAGFDNLSLDLIYGLPGQPLGRWLDVLARAVELNPEHLSCYQLSLAPDTPLGRRADRGEISLPEDEAAADLFLAGSELLRRGGYRHYEISNFARSDRLRSRHNRKYWDHTPYLGLGPAAHSFLNGRRWWNIKSIEGYIKALSRQAAPVGGGEDLGPAQLRLEALALGLRTAAGIDRRLIGPEGEAKLDSIIRAGLAIATDDRIRPTDRGLLLADALARELSD